MIFTTGTTFDPWRLGRLVSFAGRIFPREPHQYDPKIKCLNDHEGALAVTFHEQPSEELMKAIVDAWYAEGECHVEFFLDGQLFAEWTYRQEC